MHNKVLYSAVFDGDYPFGELFKAVTTITNPDHMTEKDSALILWGGGDISPSLYGHGVSKRTGAGAEPNNRDLIEWDLATRAVEMGVPVIGICRGAQLMCAMSGGYLIQDVTGHGGTHNMCVMGTNEIIATSSLHHQMMSPWGVDHKIIAFASPSRSNRYVIHPPHSAEDIILDDVPCEPEIVWFPKTKALAIQGHPEFMGVDSRYVKYCFELVNQYVLQ